MTFASFARKCAQQVKIGKPNDVAEKEKELKSALLQFLAGTGVAGALIIGLTNLDLLGALPGIRRKCHRVEHGLRDNKVGG